jgi:uncharacterized protein (TIGR02598 family)
MKQHLPSEERAFSLVEVTIAIGIAAFGIISLLGLMGAFMTSGRESAEDTVLSDIAKSVAADLRSRPFDKPASGVDNSLSSLSPPPPATPPPPAPSYYDAVGMKVSAGTSALYTCTVTLTPKTEFNTVTTNAINLYEARIEFRWPYPQNTSKKTFHINLARYAN